MRRLLLIAALLAATCGAVTLYALEGREVVVLRTAAADGSLRATRVWIADEDGSSWIEAATPERPFFRDLLANPELEVERGARHAFIAEAVPNPEGHERIRRLVRAKYGWADVWVGLLQDTSRSVAVRLRPARTSRG